MSYRQYIKNFFFWLTIGVMIFWWSRGYGFDTDTKLYVSSIDPQVKNNIYNDLSKVCENIINKWPIPLWGITYNPQESIFINVVCNSLLSPDKDKNATYQWWETWLDLTQWEFLKRKNFWQTNLLCSPTMNALENNLWDTECIPRSTTAKMDYPFLWYQLISSIENEWTNLMLSRIYGATDITKDKNEDLANIYIATHFDTIWKIIEQKNYPQTMKTLISYIKNARNIQKSNNFFDYTKLQSIKDKQSSLPNLVAFFTNTGTVWSTINIDILYNELFFYQLFSDIYNQWLQYWRSTNTKDQIPEALIFSPNLSENDIQQIRLIQQNRTQYFIGNITTAIHESIRQMQNLEYSYPLHIWLLMYQEDSIKFRDNLTKIYLPLHQLHYKLENVQSKN